MRATIKKAVFLLNILILLSSIAFAESIQNGQLHQTGLPFKTAIIEYVLTGYQEGRETVYIDTVRNKITQDIITTSTFAGEEIKEHKLNIIDGKIMYVVDLNKKRPNLLKQKEALILFLERDFCLVNLFKRPFLWAENVRCTRRIIVKLISGMASC